MQSAVAADMTSSSRLSGARPSRLLASASAAPSSRSSWQTRAGAPGVRAGKADGHHLVNQGTAPATYLEIGDRRQDDAVTYPDADLHLEPTLEGHVFTDKKGAPY